ncbi:MAG TPA: hypothetical protein DCM45_02120 [Clostridiales bacterium]|nr:hypothetical protein [Clostridiales bacterium]
MLITGQRSISTLMRIIIDIILVINLVALILLPLWLQALYNDPGLITQLDRQAYLVKSENELTI